jgi:thiosulfate/3-mercaptopyruvate sulfurtransferase
MSSRLTRRAFVGGLVGLGGLLAACGGQDAGGAGSVPSATASTVATATAYAKADLLVDAKTLAADLPNVHVIALMPAQDFAAGHIDGMMQIDWPDLDISDTSSDAALRSWQDRVEQKLGELGLTNGDRVVAYDNGTLFAARLWWVLAYLGQKEKQVLNGGLPAWKNAGQATTVTASKASPTTYRGTADPSVLARLDEVRDALKQPDIVFLDVRALNEYTAGHLPGAVNIPYTENATGGPIPLWKPQDVLRQMYTAAGVSTDKTIIPYCSTGVRSAVTYFTLRLIGYDKVKLFTGSWAEWSAHPDLPVEKGMP